VLGLRSLEDPDIRVLAVAKESSLVFSRHGVMD
jgi:hypothetical protein